MGEIEIIALLVLLAICVIAVPIFTLIKISVIDTRIERMERRLEQMLGRGGDAAETERKTAPDLSTDSATLGYEPIPFFEAEETDETPSCVVAPAETVVADRVQADAGAGSETVIAEERPESETIPSAARVRQSIGRLLAAVRSENLLSKIGVVTLVLGIGFFVKYAIDRAWIGEAARVGIGVLTGGALVGLAYRLRRGYNLYAALMTGGGIAVLYITVTLAFREYYLFSQSAAFAILIAITLFSVMLSLLYDRKELALFSLLGGYAAPLLVSTGNGNYVVLFTYLLILNSGMLAITLRRRWRIVGLASLLCTTAFYWTWLLLQFDDQRAGALLFALLFFAQFYLLALIDHLRSQRRLSPYQAVVLLAANFSMYASAVYLCIGQPVDWAGAATMAMAAVNAGVMIVLMRRGMADERLIRLVVALVVGFVALAVPVQLKGHAITLLWAVEAVILVWLRTRTDAPLFRIGAALLYTLATVSFVMDVSADYLLPGGAMQPVVNPMFLTGAFFVASLAAGVLLLGRSERGREGFDRSLLGWCTAAVAYVVPVLEIVYRFDRATPELAPFLQLVLAVFTAAYVAAAAYVVRKQIGRKVWMYHAFYGFVVAYALVTLAVAPPAQRYAFLAGDRVGLLAVRYLALPALVYLFVVLARNLRTLPAKRAEGLSWGMVAAAVALLSSGLDVTVLLLGGGSDNYFALLHSVHTIGYPILWSLAATILMLWGLRVRNVLLRRISLALFALAVLKFYAFDIWSMSQAGRIVSFVALGAILLAVSFLMQKIRKLVRSDMQPELEENTDDHV